MIVNVKRLCTGIGTKAGDAEAVKKLLHKNNRKVHCDKVKKKHYKLLKSIFTSQVKRKLKY